MLANKNRNGDLQHKTQCHCRTIGIGLNVLRTTSQLWVFLGICFSQQKLNDFDTIIMCLHKSLEVCNHPCSIAVIFMHHFDGQAKTLSLSAGQSYFGQGSAQACRCPWLAFLSLGWIGMSQLGWWNQIQELPCFVTTKDYKGRRWGINVKDEDGRLRIMMWIDDETDAGTGCNGRHISQHFVKCKRDSGTFWEDHPCRPQFKSADWFSNPDHDWCWNNLNCSWYNGKFS